MPKITGTMGIIMESTNARRERIRRGLQTKRKSERRKNRKQYNLDDEFLAEAAIMNERSMEVIRRAGTNHT